MKNRQKALRRSLWVSALAIVLCCAMLVGTTFAWFTDSVSSTGNTIQAGTLDIAATVAKVEATATPAYTIEGVNGGKAFGFGEAADLEAEGTGPIISETLWEPGKTSAKLLTVTNNGNLAAKVKLSFDIAEDSGLTGALWYDFVQIKDGQAVGQFTRRPMSTLNGYADGIELPLGPANEDGSAKDAALPNSVSFILAYGMDEEAGNEYQGKSFAAAVSILATQYTYEADGFGSDQYDFGAAYPSLPSSVNATLTGTVAESSVTVLTNESGTVRADIPAGALNAGAAVKLTVATEKLSADSAVYGIELTDEEGNTLALQEKIAVKLNIGKGLRAVTVKHNGAEMAKGDYSYDRETGVLTICTSSFSPFEVLFEHDAAASVNGAAYTTVEEALEAAGADDVVYLLKDVALTRDAVTAGQVVVENGRAVTIDLAGHKLTSTYAGWSVVNYGELTVNDSGNTGIICNTSTEAGDSTHFILRNHGTMIVNGGTFGDEDTDRTNGNKANWGAALINLDEGDVTINGGYFTCGDNYWAGKPAGANYSYAIRNYGTMTIKEGTVYGKMNGGVAADGGSIAIQGGDFSVTGANTYYVLVTGAGSIKVTGGSFEKIDDNNGRLLGGFQGMPSWNAEGKLEENGYTITGGVFKVNGEEHSVV